MTGTGLAARVNHQSAQGSEPQKSPSTLFVGNLILIGAFGVALSGWILYYTDYFGVFGGLLSLTGIFSWLAFVSKALPERRLKALQVVIYRWFFNSFKARVTVLLLFFLGLVVAAFFGTVQVESLQEASDRALWVHRYGSETPEPERLTPGGRVRSLVRTSWWSPSNIRIKVSGYPDQVALVKPWRRLRLYVPSSFLRPVAVVRPSVELINFIQNNPMPLVVKAGGREVARIKEFDGHAMWIGCDDDVQIPASLEDVWRGELVAAGHLSLLHYWLHPRQLEGARLELQPNAEIEVMLERRGGGVYTGIHFVARRLHRREDFPQVEVIDVPR